MFAYHSQLRPIPIRYLVLFALLVLAVLQLLPGMDQLVEGREGTYRLMAEDFKTRLSGGEQGMVIGDFGYPLLSALCSFLSGDVRLVLNVVSWLSAGLAIWLFDLNLRLASSGARSQSRFAYTFVLLLLAPAFVQAALAALPVAFALLLLLAVLWLSGKAMDTGGGLPVIGAFSLVGPVLAVQPTLWPILIVLLLATARQMARWGRIAILGGMISVLALSFWPFSWVAGDQWAFFLIDASLIRQWSIWNWIPYKLNAPAENGLSSGWPNWFYILFPLFHPAFCLVLPGLLLLLKRTDWQLPFRRTLLVSLCLYLFYIGGLPVQSIHLLLPAYILMLLLLFQAWDRFQSYGEFFLPRLAYAIIGVCILVQLAANLAYGLPLR